MGNIKKLEILELSLDLAIIIYKKTFDAQLSKDFALKDQIRRSAISVPSNIAEGAASGYDKLGLRYFYNARGSLVELETQLIIATRIGHLNKIEHAKLSINIEVIHKKLNKLIKYRKEIIAR